MQQHNWMRSSWTELPLFLKIVALETRSSYLVPPSVVRDCRLRILITNFNLSCWHSHVKQHLPDSYETASIYIFATHNDHYSVCECYAEAVFSLLARLLPWNGHLLHMTLHQVLQPATVKPSPLSDDGDRDITNGFNTV